MDLVKDRNQIFWILQFTGWLLLGLLYLFLYYRNYLGEPLSIFLVALTYIIGFNISLVLRYFYKRISIQNKSLSQIAVIVIAGSLLASQIWYWVDMGISVPIPGNEELWELWTIQRYLSHSYYHFLILSLWSALYFGIKLWMEWSIQRIRTEKANALAQAAQLQMLRYQLNPHFLFNSLNSIRALVDEDRKNAKEMITELSEFLRYSLISKNFSNVPLKQELEAVRHYFAIEKKRFEEKLEIKYEVDPLAEEFPVLSFMLHPIVENAVKYGMKTSKIPLQIELSAQVSDGVLNIGIKNSGHWVDSKDKHFQSTGTGLENIKKRLENAFPDCHEFIVEKSSDSVVVIIRLKKTVGTNEEEA